jgi:hypothetical protein
LSRLKDAVVAYVRRQEWPYDDSEERIVSFPGFGEHGAWTVHVALREDDEQLMVHSVVPEDVPEDRRTDLALFLTRANFGLVLGNWELDLDDGELRFKTSADVEDVELVDVFLDNLVLANVATTDRYLPGIRAVLGGADPAAAVAEVEAAD